ncbi:MAG: BlaI/MecI/CopY family transcriptional regulator [Firmicutes bacterium]|nr:BlaI/MecI/CopY family transcriptional regulator [Bacillota bacterium]
MMMKEHYDITDSEWVVMRVLLDKHPMGSKEIISILAKKKGWSNATIKTFLGRLVAKNIISYKIEKNAFFYYPLISELKYIQNELKLFFGKLYGDTMIHETKNFVFSGNGSTHFVETLANCLEENYPRMASDLGFNFPHKQMVYIHASLESLHSALGYENGPKWMTAGWFWEIIHIAPEEVFENSSVSKSSLHVLVQLMLHHINENAPFWLKHGISVYEAGWKSQEQMKISLNQIRDSISPFMVYDLSTNLDLFEKQKGFEITQSVIEYIVETFKKEKLKEYLRNPENISGIFGCTQVTFWEEWINFIHKKYTDESNI